MCVKHGYSKTEVRELLDVAIKSEEECVNDEEIEKR